MTTIADIIGHAIRHPGWYTCRRCRHPFRSTTYYAECFDCWLTHNPTPAA